MRAGEIGYAIMTSEHPTHAITIRAGALVDISVAHVRLDLRPMPVSFDDACKRFGNASASVVELV